jgi:hypothetical protein
MQVFIKEKKKSSTKLMRSIKIKIVMFKYIHFYKKKYLKIIVKLHLRPELHLH